MVRTGYFAIQIVGGAGIAVMELTEPSVLGCYRLKLVLVEAATTTCGVLGSNQP